MARFKLPESLKAWKVSSALPEKNGYAQYAVSRKEVDGSITQAVLTHVAFNDEKYSSDNVQYINEEAAFIKNVMRCGVSNYVAAEVIDRPQKKRLAMFIITECTTTLSEKLKNKHFEENDIIDFGMQMSDLLSKLEKNNIFHGNLHPDNIYVTEEGRYKLGGFTDFESSIADLSFIAPEIQNGTAPDYTTDLYSLGLMMYAMCNDGAIPFETQDVDRESAIAKRFEGESITAPPSGSEKLKSVIVIACQPDKRNRWKNAGNLKNALASINSDAAAVTQPKEEIIAPKSTEFKENVFEESAFTEEKPSDASANTQNNNAVTAVAAGAAVAAAAANTASNKKQPKNKNLDEIKDALRKRTSTPAEAVTQNPSENVTVAPPEKAHNENPAPGNQKPSEADKAYTEPEIDNRVFDDYQLQTKVFTLNDAPKDSKNYGEYFDDEPEVETTPDPAKKDDSEFGQNEFYEDNSFYADQKEEEKRSRKGMIIAIAAVVAVVALLSVLGVLAFTNNWFDNKGKPAEQVATVQPYTEATAAPSTAPATTAPATEPTTKSTEKVYAPNVLGNYYDYAKSVLEDAGFKVERGEDGKSQYYEEGLVMSMDPTSEDLIEPGSTITLYVSSGKIEDADNNEGENNNDNANNEDEEYNDYNYSYDDYDYSYEEGDANGESSGDSNNNNAESSNSNRPRNRN